jgi:DNA-binding HxlR family transcriptional regulator
LSVRAKSIKGRFLPGEPEAASGAPPTPTPGQASAGTASRSGEPAASGPPPPGASSPPALERATFDLDRLIHERMRLGIVSALAVNERLSFNDLKSLLRTSDGNLSVHARKLEEARYIHCEKSFVGRLPKTEYRLTAAGKRALERYLDHMEAIIHATRAPEAPGMAEAAKA